MVGRLGLKGITSENKIHGGGPGVHCIVGRKDNEQRHQKRCVGQVNKPHQENPYCDQLVTGRQGAEMEDALAPASGVCSSAETHFCSTATNRSLLPALTVNDCPQI